MLHPWAQVDDEPAVVIPRILVVHALLDVDVDAADGIYDLLKGVDVDDDVVVDLYAEEVLHCTLCELFAPIGVRGVDLVVAVARDGDACVARDGEERGLILYRVDGRDHECIAAPHVALALVDAHNHDRCLVLCREQLLLVLLLHAVEQAALREKRARDGSEDKDEDGSEQDVRPDAFLR